MERVVVAEVPVNRELVLLNEKRMESGRRQSAKNFGIYLLNEKRMERKRNSYLCSLRFQFHCSMKRGWKDILCEGGRQNNGNVTAQ
jgi:hypothetical protein